MKSSSPARWRRRRCRSPSSIPARCGLRPLHRHPGQTDRLMPRASPTSPRPSAPATPTADAQARNSAPCSSVGANWSRCSRPRRTACPWPPGASAPTPGPHHVAAATDHPVRRRPGALVARARSGAPKTICCAVPRASGPCWPPPGGALPELGTLTRQQIAALVGVAPHRERHPPGPPHRLGWARPGPHRALHGTLVAVRHNPVLAAFYAARAAGKAPKVALTACMRKLLTILNAMLKHHTLGSRRLSTLDT